MRSTVEPVNTFEASAVEVLKEHKIAPTSPVARMFLAVCQRYGLDPFLNHVDVLPLSGGYKVYVTRDGMLDIAHRSGQLDGIVVDELREGDSGWAATVTVWRKDMGHPFTYSAGCGKQEPIAKQGKGPEMALARAERRALKRAFRIPTADDDDVTATDVVVPAGVPEIEEPRVEREERPVADPGEVSAPAAPPVAGVNQGPAHAAIGRLPKEHQDRFLADHGIEQFGDIWPEDAVADALERPF